MTFDSLAVFLRNATRTGKVDKRMPEAMPGGNFCMSSIHLLGRAN
jgi:hypothetical protein